MLSGYADGRQREEAQEEREDNQKYDLNVYGSWQGRQPGPDQDAPQVSNVESKPQQAYNAADNSWSPIKKAASGSNQGRAAQGRQAQGRAA